MDKETVIAVANATEAAANLGTKALDSADKLGAFLGPLVRGPLGRLSRYVDERIAIWAEGNLLALRTKIELQWRACGYEVPLRPVPLAFALDVIEQGALEDDDSLQDLWARLLTNAADATTGVDARRSYISILRDFTALDAVVFQRVYSVSPGPEDYVSTSGLPAGVSLIPMVNGPDLPEPPDAVKASISNLERLGLLRTALTYKGAEIHSRVHQTFAGRELAKAIKDRVA